MSGKPVDIEHWSRIASEWTAWARAPNHDAFWAYRASLISFIGHGAGDSLDVGCGEGRVSRVLKECGYRVVAIDPVEKLISAAEQAGSADYYRIAAATDLGFSPLTPFRSVALALITLASAAPPSSPAICHSTSGPACSGRRTRRNATVLERTVTNSPDVFHDGDHRRRPASHMAAFPPGTLPLHGVNTSRRG
jgi:SAM-dependent methyltransferase